jgi:hypothetical protein
MERASRQKAAVEAILKVSGLYVEYDDLIGDDGRWDNSKIAALHDPGWLERVLGRDFCHNVRAVSYSRTLNFPPGSVGVHDVPTETLQRLKDMPDLRYLDLSWKNVTDADLIYVLPLVQLRHLEVLGTKVTDAGVRRLQEALPNCKIVH